MNTSPLDRDADALYSRLVAEAAAAGLLAYAYGGVATILTPAEQRSNGCRSRTLQAAQLAEHPENPVLRADDAPAQAEESGDLFPADVPSVPPSSSSPVKGPRSGRNGGDGGGLFAECHLKPGVQS